jgi:hypothetical protein
VATISNLYIDQGSTFNSVITLTSQNGTPLNLTGYTVKSQFRKSFASSVSHDFAASVFNPTAGQVRISLSAEASSAVPAGRYLYDIEVTSTVGEKIRALEGLVIITPEITKT